MVAGCARGDALAVQHAADCAVVHAQLLCDGPYRPLLHEVQADDALFDVLGDHVPPRSASSERAAAGEGGHRSAARASTRLPYSRWNSRIRLMERFSGPDRHGPKPRRGCSQERRRGTLVRHRRIAAFEVALLAGGMMSTAWLRPLIAARTASSAVTTGRHRAVRTTVAIATITPRANDGETGTTATVELTVSVLHWPRGPEQVISHLRTPSCSCGWG